MSRFCVLPIGAGERRHRKRRKLAVTVNVAETDPAGIVIDLITRRRGLLLDSNTMTPPTGAAAVRVTMQVVDIPGATLLGLQISCETGSGSPKEMVENEKMATAATPRLLHGFDFRIEGVRTVAEGWQEYC